MMKKRLNKLFLFVGGFILLIILLLQMFKKRENFEPDSENKTTITCVKGKLTKKKTGVKQRCPAGYKKKQ